MAYPDGPKFVSQALGVRLCLAYIKVGASLTQIFG
jgi:hypothetical protein